MRLLAWFVWTSCVYFLLCVVGSVLSLAAAFDTQVSFWDAPGEATLAYLSDLLLAPLTYVRHFLPVSWQGGYAEIAVVSMLFGAVVVVLLNLHRMLGKQHVH